MRILILFTGLFILVGCHSNKTVLKKHTGKRKIIPQKEVVGTERKKESELSSNEKKPKVANIKPIVHIERPRNAREATLAYIEKFAPIAVKEMQDYKIPASITLAQGILESGRGNSPLAKKSNNHFGIKCHRGWTGQRVTHDDDEPGECFRKYRYAENSYEDHSKFLTSRKRYSKLFKLEITDYKGWAYGLKRAGYATDPSYPVKLIALIKRYQLTEYDKMGSRITNTKKEYIVTNIGENYKYYVVKKGDTLYSIARKNNINLNTLKKINKLYDNNINIGQKLIVNK